MKYLIKLYRVFNYLSFDVVLGALLMLGLLSKSLQIGLPFSNYVMLGVAVFVVYSADHLLDVRMIRHAPFTGRYLFFFHHRFLVVALCTLTTGLVVMAHCYQTAELSLFVSGVALTLMGGVHYLLNRVEKKPLLFRKRVSH